MKWTLLILLLLQPLLYGTTTTTTDTHIEHNITQEDKIIWQHDYDDALEYAQKVHKPLLIFMSQERCGSCKYMKEEVFTDAPLIAYINAHFIPVMLDISDMMVPDELQVEATPTFHFLDEHGIKLRESLIGGKTAPFFLPLLQKVIEKK